MSSSPTISAPTESTQSVSVFFSYCHSDESLCVQLRKQLSVIQRKGHIFSWHDRKITPGATWNAEIDKNLKSAEIVLLLVSADFLASDYCYEIELKQSLERYEKGEVRLIPIILRACDWQEAPFGKLQALPKDGRPVTSWSNIDEAFLDVVRGIRQVVVELLGAKAQSLYQQIASDAQKNRDERWKMAQALQAKIFAISQDVNIPNMRSADKAFSNMDVYINDSLK